MWLALWIKFVTTTDTKQNYTQWSQFWCDNNSFSFTTELQLKPMWKQKRQWVRNLAWNNRMWVTWCAKTEGLGSRLSFSAAEDFGTQLFRHTFCWTCSMSSSYDWFSTTLHFSFFARNEKKKTKTKTTEYSKSPNQTCSVVITVLGMTKLQSL